MKFMDKMKIYILIILLCNVAHAQTILRFQPEVSPQAKRLGDILQIENDEQHWAELPLQSNPSSGELIQKETIIHWMHKQIGPFRANWRGKTRIQVHQATQSTAPSLIAKAKTALLNQLNHAHKYTHVQIEPISTPKDSTYPLDELQPTLNLHYPVARRVCVWLTHPNQKSHQMAIWFKVRAYASVVVAKHAVRYHTPLNNADFSREERNIAGLGAEPVRVVPNQGWLTSSLAKGAILLSDHIQEPPLVIQGQPVNVTVHHGAITITMQAIAVKDGYVGQTTTVKNPLNQKTFDVRITGYQQAEITA